jgi:hypothetical protein
MFTIIFENSNFLNDKFTGLIEEFSDIVAYNITVNQ